MKSIQSNFWKLQKKNSGWGSYICFVEAVRGKKYTMRSIREAFNKLVDKGDYADKEKKDILAGLLNITNGVEDCQSRG